MQLKTNINCPSCSSAQIIKYGKIQKHQRYLCKICKTQFGENAIEKKSSSNTMVRHALVLYLQGHSYREVADYIKVNYVTVYNYLQKYNYLFNEIRNSNSPEKVTNLQLEKILSQKVKVNAYHFLLIDLETSVSYIS